MASVFLFASGPASATQSAPTQSVPPQFRSATDLVVTDVSVLNGRRVPVRGLTAADFEVTENGQRQTIEMFVEVEASAGAPATGQTGSGVASQVDDGRLVVILMDDQQILGPFGIKAAWEVGRAIIASLDPRDRAAVIFVSRASPAAVLTTARAGLVAAVDGFLANQLGGSTVQTMAEAIDIFSAHPGRRKLLIYIGAGMRLESGVLTAAARLGASLDPQGQMGLMVSQMQALFGAAQRANVNIYMFDANGLTPYSTEERGDPRRYERDFMISVANETGGRYFLNSNSPAREAARVLAENSSYYLIGFRSSTPPDNKYRRLEIKVKKRGLTVRTRRGYFAAPPGSK